MRLYSVVKHGVSPLLERNPEVWVKVISITRLQREGGKPGKGTIPSNSNHLLFRRKIQTDWVTEATGVIVRLYFSHISLVLTRPDENCERITNTYRSLTEFVRYQLIVRSFYNSCLIRGYQCEIVPWILSNKGTLI